MATASDQLAEHYLVALRTHLAQGPESDLAVADTLGRQSIQLRLDVLELVKIHEQALVTLMSQEHLSVHRNGTIKRAGDFFRRTLTPLVTVAITARHGRAHMEQADTKPASLTIKLTAAGKKLERETARRKTVEARLRESKKHYTELAKQSRFMQEQLRHLSHRVLEAQEEERKHISRELHDEISQILIGINVRLAALKIEAATNTEGLKKKITSTQKLVEKSVAAVHLFARQLRPAMLDDLGLIPTLLAQMKEVRRRTGLQIEFTSETAIKIEQLDSVKRTALYRIAQEALTNVAKHAQATRVKVSIQLDQDSIHMQICDDGKPFDVDRILAGKKKRNCLGIIGMRERMEMVNGTFSIESVEGEGTAVRVSVPLCKRIKE